MNILRISQHGSLLVALTSAQGLLAPYAIALPVPSDYTISTVESDVQIANDYATVTVTDQGSVSSGSGAALNVNQGVTLTTLKNDGVISSSNSGNSADVFSLQNAGTIGTIDNTGTISNLNNTYSSYKSSAVNLTSTSDVTTFNNSGTIIGPANSSYYSSSSDYANNAGITNAGHVGTLNNVLDASISGYSGITNTGTIDALNNAGTITNTGSGNGNGNYYPTAAVMNTGTIGSLYNSGSITSDNTSNGYDNSGIYNRGTISTLVNDSAIQGASFGIYNDGQINSLTNNGSITGNVVGIYNRNISNNNGNVGNIVNNGTISGAYGIYSYNYDNGANQINLVNTGIISGSQYAVFSSGNGSSGLSITNTGVIKGSINSGNGALFEISGGTNNAGVLTGLDGVGDIASTSDVIFRSGSLLLNDNIITNGNTILNDAANLQVNNTLIVSGNYHQNAAAALIIGVSDSAVANGDTTADSGYGRLNVTGSATVDSGSSVILGRTGSTYSFAKGQRYVVIDANATDTNYNADTLKYKAVGYTGAVTGSTYNDGTNSALVVTLVNAPTTPVVTTPPTTTPVVTTPVVTTPVVTPPVVTTPVVTPPVTTEPTPNKGWATIPNATSSLGGLTSYSGISPQLLNLYNASLAIDGKKEANRVGERLSTGQNISASTATGVANTTAMAVVGNHMDTVRNPQTAGVSGVSTGDAYSNWIVWGQPYGGYARQDGTSDVSGYSAKFGGLLLGADRALGDNWRAGAALNYSNTSVHGKDNLTGNTSTADSYGVIGYAAYTGNPWFLNLSAAVNRQNYDSVRRADFTGFSGAAKGDFNGQSVTLQSELGYPLTLPSDVVITPLAGVTYSYQHIDDYKETGGNGMALDVDASHSQSVTSDIGARVEKTFDTRLGNLTPFAQISWIHQYDNRRMSSGASYAADTIGETQFTTKGAAPVKDMAGLSLGSTLYSANDLTLDARYDVQAGDRYQAHTFSLRLNKSF
nr:autotransporter domain-containing protein [uncultured Enterobacter sp.]